MAIHFFEKAIEKDHEYALAWAGIADTYSLMGEYTIISRRKLYPKQMAAVNKALEIDNRLGEAHISLAISLMLNEWDWKNSEKEYKLGIELSPNYATGHHWYADWLLYNGYIPEAYDEISLAVELDPVSQGILKDKGTLYYYSQQYDKAIEIAKKTLELDPDFFPAYRLLSLAYTSLGKFDEAIAENERWGRGTKSSIKTDLSLAYIYVVSGRDGNARKIIEQPGLEDLLGANDHRSMALVYAALGEKDKAFEWLERSILKHEESVCSLMIDHKFDPVRKDPRFDTILKKIGLVN